MASQAEPGGPVRPTPEEELLYGRGQSGRVFVSSQMRDRRGRKTYAAERSALADAIDAIPRLRPWLWERDAPVGDYCAEGICVRLAATSECLVLIVGRELTPTTRREYEAARAADVHCFVYQDVRVRANPEVKALVATARERAVTGDFSSPEELALKAVEALMERAVFTMRRDIIARRERASEVRPIEDRSEPWNEPPKYVQSEAAFGEAPDRPDTFKTVVEMVSEIRQTAEAGGRGEAFHELHYLASDLYSGGRADLALELIDELRGMFPPGEMDPVEDAWVLNTEALALARVGRDSDAAERWERMRTVGERLGDKALTATALQNLAIDAIRGDRLDDAKRLTKESAEIKLELEDYRSVLQLMNSRVLIAIEEGAYAEAEDQLDFYERVAREAQDVHLLTSAHGNRGKLLVAQGKFRSAEREYRRALQCARKTGNPVDEVLGLQNLGAVCADQERWGEATRWYRKGIRLADDFELPVEREVLRRSLASVLHRAGRNREAVVEFDRARQAAWALGDKHQWAVATLNLGGVYTLAGKAAEAVEPLEQAVSTFRELGDLEWEARARSSLAAARDSLGDVAAATDTAVGALRLLPADDHEGRARLLRQAAETALGDPALLRRAAELFELALDEEAHYLDAGEVGWRSAVAAHFISDAGAEGLALPLFDRAVDTLSSGRHLFDAYNDRAVALAGLGRFDEARTSLQHAHTVADSLDDPVLRQRALANLGEVERRRGATSTAVHLLREALGQSRHLSDDELIAEALGNLALALEEANQVQDAAATLDELRELGDRYENDHWRARAADGYARASFTHGDFRASAESYRRALELHRRAGSDSTFALGGLLEALSAGKLEEGLQDAAQELVNKVEEGHDPRLAVQYLSTAARSWLRHGELEEATSLFAGAVLVGLYASGAEDGHVEEDGEGSREEARPLALAVISLVDAARESSVRDEEVVYRGVIGYLNARYENLGEHLKPIVELARQELDRHNVTVPGSRSA